MAEEIFQAWLVGQMKEWPSLRARIARMRNMASENRRVRTYKQKASARAASERNYTHLKGNAQKRRLFLCSKNAAAYMRGGERSKNTFVVSARPKRNVCVHGTHRRKNDQKRGGREASGRKDKMCSEPHDLWLLLNRIRQIKFIPVHLWL